MKIALFIIICVILVVIGCKPLSPSGSPFVYSGTVVSGEIQNDWQKTHISKLETAIGQKLPLPTYLPSDYVVKEAYYSDATLNQASTYILLLISDQPVNWTGNHYTCRMTIAISWNETGLGIHWLANKGESVNDGYGVLMQTDKEFQLLWPSYGSPQSMGSTLELRTGLLLGRGELIKIAETIPYPNPLPYPHKVSLYDANKILNADLPHPTYLPANYSLTGIYLLEYSKSREELALTFYPSGEQDFGAEHIEQAPIRMYARLFPDGQFGGLKLIGEGYDISGTPGILVTNNDSHALWWIQNYREFPGQYEIVLATTKDIAKQELVIIARSVPQSGWTR